MGKAFLCGVCASLLLLSMTVQSSMSQNEGGRQNGRGEGRNGGGREGRNGGRGGQRQNGEAGVPNKFPGMGSFDAWKSSLPELHAGQKCMREKQWDQAIAHFKASLDLYEFQPHCYLQMGRALQRKDANVADQEKCFRKALKLDQTNWHAWKELANVLYITKRYDEARESLASAIQLNPPQQGKEELEKMIRDVDSAQRNADTGSRNTD